MAYSKNLSNNHDASSGVTDWTVVNVVEDAGQFKLGPAAASMYQTRDVSTLDFNVKGFRLYVKFTRVAISGSIVDFAYLRVNYAVGYTIVQIPLRGDGTNEVEYDFAIDNVATSITIGVDKASTDTIYVDELSYYHDDNPFTYEVAEVDKPDNSIITDAYGIHIYNGNAFEGGTLRVSLGEYSAEEFGLLIKGNNAETVINEYGINPKFLDYSKNLIWNSSFEVADSSNKPYFWVTPGLTPAISSADSVFYGTKSLKIPSGAKTWQSWAARIKPWWIQNQVVRVSMYANFVQNFKVRVVDIGTWQESTGAVVRYYLLTDSSGSTGSPITGDDGAGSELQFTGSNGWEDSRITLTFDSDQYPSDSGTNNITAFALEIENVDTGDIYIDGVMTHVDFTGKWAQLYKDGPRSVSVVDIGDYWTDPVFDPDATPTESAFEGGGGGGGATSADQVSYDNTETGMAATNVQDGIDELFTSVSDGKVLLADAITDRGIYTEPTETFEEMANKILLMLKMIQVFATDQFSINSAASFNDVGLMSIALPATQSLTDTFSTNSEAIFTSTAIVEVT